MTGPVSGATVTYVYDGFSQLRSATPVGEAVVTMDYEALHRTTRTTYPDGTSRRKPPTIGRMLRRGAIDIADPPAT